MTSPLEMAKIDYIEGCEYSHQNLYDITAWLLVGRGQWLQIEQTDGVTTLIPAKRVSGVTIEPQPEGIERE